MIEKAYWKFVRLIRSPKGLFQFFFSLFVIAIPFSKRAIIYKSSTTHLFDPFSTSFLYLTDILLVIAVFFFGLAIFRGKLDLRFYDGHGQRYFWVFLLIMYLLTLGSALTAGDPKLVFLIAAKGLIYLSAFYLLANGYFDLKRILRIFIYSMLLQVFLSLSQYYFQQSFGLSMLGEISFDQSTLGVAKIDYNGEKIVRSYGTFLHPNVLGGFSLFASIFCYYLWKNKRQQRWFYMLFLFLITIVLSFSRSVFLAGAVGLVAYLILINPRLKNAISLKKIVAGLAILVAVIFSSQIGNLLSERLSISADDKSVSHRLNYMDISYEMLRSKPLGIGASHFTMDMQNFTLEKLLPWERQPVHNVFLLIATELGLIAGVVLISFFIWLSYCLYSRNQQFLLSFDRHLNRMLLFTLICGFVISIFDHYLVTNNSVLYLLAIFGALCTHSLDSRQKIIRTITL